MRDGRGLPIIPVDLGRSEPDDQIEIDRKLRNFLAELKKAFPQRRREGRHD